MLPVDKHTSNTRNVVIFGAGLAGRGFLAHLLFRAGYGLTFIESNPQLVHAMRSTSGYHVRVVGNSGADCEVREYAILHSSETEPAARAIAGAALVFTAVGGSNLASLAALLAEGIRRRMGETPGRDLNIIVCENFYRPAVLLRKVLSSQLSDKEKLFLDSHIGIAEAQVLRSCMARPEAGDPLAVEAEDYWHLPVNVKALCGPLPAIQGLCASDTDGDGLVFKLYTYNSISATIAYLGYQAGYALLAQAANDPMIALVADGVADETSSALVKEFGIDSDEVKLLVDGALKKFRDPAIVDPIARNARDPARKLSRHDRLIGPAVLAIGNGIPPVNIVTAIVAAFRYDDPDDPSAANLQRRLRRDGLAATLRDICGLESSSPLAALVIRAYESSFR